MEMEFSMPRDNVAEDEFKYLTPDVSNESLKFMLLVLLIVLNFFSKPHSTQI